MAHGILRLALFISGGGSTMQAILRAFKEGRITGMEPALVVSSRPDAVGIQKARSEGVPEKDILVLQRKSFRDESEFGDALREACRERGIDLIGQYGWLPFTPVNLIEAYPNQIVNQHPGPLQGSLPAFGGKGMYGRRVHCARLLFVRWTKRDLWTSVVSHYLAPDKAYDTGQVIHERRVPIQPDDTVETLAARALPIEHLVQIETLQMLGMNTLRVPKSNGCLVKATELGVLELAKRAAIALYPKG